MEAFALETEEYIDGAIFLTESLTTFKAANELPIHMTSVENVTKKRFRGLTYLDDKHSTWTCVTVELGECFEMKVFLLICKKPHQNFNWSSLLQTLNNCLKEVVCYQMGNCKTTQQNYAVLQSGKKEALVASADFYLFGPLFLAVVKQELEKEHFEIECKYLIEKIGQSCNIRSASKSFQNNYNFEEIEEIVLHRAHDMESEGYGLFWKLKSDLVTTAKRAGCAWVSNNKDGRYFAGAINGACNQNYFRGPVSNKEPQVIALKMYSDLFKYCHLQKHGRPIRAFRALDLYWRHIWETSATKRRLRAVDNSMIYLKGAVEHIFQPFYNTKARAEIIISVSKPYDGPFNDSIIQRCLEVGKNFYERLNLYSVDYLMVIPMEDLRTHIGHKLIPALKTIEHFHDDLHECLSLRGLSKISTYTTDDLLSVYASEIIALYFLYGTFHSNWFTPRGQGTFRGHEDDEEEDENGGGGITRTNSKKIGEDRRVASDLGLLKLNNGEGLIWEWGDVMQPRDDGRLLYQPSRFPRCLLIGLECKVHNCNYTVGDLLCNLYDAEECSRAILDEFAKFLLYLTVQKRDCKKFETLGVCFRRFCNSSGPSNSVVVSVSDFIGRFFEEIPAEGRSRNIIAYDQWLAKWISNFEFTTDNFERLKARMIALYEKTILEFNQCLVYQKSTVVTYIVVPNYEYPTRVMEELDFQTRLTEDQYQVKVANIYMQAYKLRFKLENLSRHASNEFLSFILSAMRDSEYSKFDSLKEFGINVYDDLFKSLNQG